MFDDLHDPNPPTPGLDDLATVSKRAQSIRRRRALTALGGAVALVALVAGIVVIPRLGDAERIVTVDTSSPDTSASPVPQTTVTDEVTPSTDLPVDDCAVMPRPPVFVVDGTSPGQPTTTSQSDGTVVVTWGAGDASTVMQVLGPVVADQAPIRTLEVGSFTAFISDRASEDDSYVVAIVDRADGCRRTYRFGDDVSRDVAELFTEQWLTILSMDRTISTYLLDDRSVCLAIAAASMEVCAPFDVDIDGPTPVSGAVEVGDGVVVGYVVVERGSVVSPASGLQRRVAVEGTEIDLVFDYLLDNGYCGTVTSPPPGNESRRFEGGELACADTGLTPGSAPPIVAIDGAGDAVMITDATSPPIVLTDGVDPDDQLPGEGDVAFIDGVTLSDDGSMAVVGFCCEPGAGTLMAVDTATLEPTSLGYGHLPAAAGANVIAASLGTINVVGPDGSIAATLLDDPDGWVIDLAVGPGDLGPVVLAIVVDPQGTRLWRGFAGGGDMFLEAVLSTTEEVSEPNYSLAGYAGTPTDRVYLVLDESTDTLLRFDADTLTLVASGPSPVGATSMWVANDVVRYVDGQRRLVVNDVQVPGEYVWVR